MAGKDIIMLRQEELKRLHIIKKVSEGILKQKDAAELLLIMRSSGKESDKESKRRRRQRDSP